MVAMGGFMGAAVIASIQNSKNGQESRENDLMEQGNRIHQEVSNAVLFPQKSFDAARAEATRILGRPETYQERVKRECDMFGYSMPLRHNS